MLVKSPCEVVAGRERVTTGDVDDPTGGDDDSCRKGMSAVIKTQFSRDLNHPAK